MRPDHDAISYEAISNADLMVFVITNELFDSHLGQHYRKLAIDHEKAYETILVVNKMGRHANGNTPEAQAIITEDLRKPLEPFTPEDLRITFTDAESALEAQTETDPEFANDQSQEGNLDGLSANLNELIRQQGLLGRHTTVLYSIDQVLQDAIKLEPTEAPDADRHGPCVQPEYQSHHRSKGPGAAGCPQCRRKGHHRYLNLRLRIGRTLLPGSYAGRIGACRRESAKPVRRDTSATHPRN